jgi:hypothetical protein
MDMEITPEEVRSFLNSLQYVIPPAGYLFVLAGSLAFRLVQICAYAPLTQMFARQLNIRLDYRTALRLAAVAITPVVLIRTLIWFGPWEPAWYLRWPAALLITVLYLRFAAQACVPEAVVNV